MTDDLPQAFHKLAVAAIPQAARGFALPDSQLVEIADEGRKAIRTLAAEVTRLTKALATMKAGRDGAWKQLSRLYARMDEALAPHAPREGGEG